MEQFKRRLSFLHSPNLKEWKNTDSSIAKSLYNWYSKYLY